MALPTGEEEDDDLIDTTATHNPDVPSETGTALDVTPEVERQVGEHADEIIRLAQSVEIMAITRGKLEEALRRSELTANVLEGKALKSMPVIKHIPLLRSIPIPLEAIISFIPFGVGDVIAASAALHIVTEAHMAGVPRSEIKKMLMNIAKDVAIGAVPLIGDIFDFFYKSNNYNIEIFRKYVQEYVVKHEALKGTIADAQAQKRFNDSRNLG